MVTFKLIQETDTSVLYEYYPENDKHINAGLIELNVTEKRIDVIRPSQGDSYRVITAESIVAMRDGTNVLRVETGKVLLDEGELAEEMGDEGYYLYASYAIRHICEAYGQGEILSEGMAMWC